MAVGMAVAAIAAASLGAGMAAADVKAGVDAWKAGDYRRAVDAWRGPAVAGDADAQFNLGQAYKLGRGVPIDPALAESWFRKAALQGHAQAEDNYGLALFQSGRRAEAVPWLEKSVARGEPRGQLVLGTMLFNGDDVAKDWARAYALMTRASASGLASASQTLAQMDGYLSPEDRQRGTALARAYEADAGRAALPGTRDEFASGTTRAGDRAPARADARAPDRAPNRAVVIADLPPSRIPDAPRPAPGATPASTAAHPSAGKMTLPSRPGEPARPALRPVVAARLPTAPHTAPAPATKSAVSGRYCVQLGAFRDENNARTLWARVGARVGGQPSYARVGGIVRLQAGPYATRDRATRACAAATASGSQCAIVAP